MSLEAYKKKRDLKKSKEPAAKKKKSTGSKEHIFVVQKHAASHLHYDFRLAMGGVLASWALPKGPTLNPKSKRLAIHVEDHPFAYKDFEGVIETGYGAGTVMVWDTGFYELIEGSLSQGKLTFNLDGEKLKGHFSLVKFKNGEKDEWLFIKGNDTYATTKEILKQDRSVLTGRSMEEIEEDA